MVLTYLETRHTDGLVGLFWVIKINEPKKIEVKKEEVKKVKKKDNADGSNFERWA